jgi:hypothetical protein
LAEEVLRQAQETIKAQLAAGDRFTTELTTLFGQGVSLSLAAFGAAVLAFDKRWLPCRLVLLRGSTAAMRRITGIHNMIKESGRSRIGPNPCRLQALWGFPFVLPNLEAADGSDL